MFTATLVSGAAWETKVDPWVLQTASETSSTEFLVFVRQQADLSAAESLPTKEAKGRWVVDQLRQVADASQGPVLTELRRLGVPHRPFWIANMIWVQGDRTVIRALAQHPDIAHLYANPRVRLVVPEVGHERVMAPQGIEWNVTQIGAPAFWSSGYTGEGVVIAGQDTGYDWDHPALKNQYRGWNGVSVDHNYNWHDAIHSGGGSCGADSPEPCDDGNHGTHTMGTMIGDDGGPNQIGVAPGAEWIGCRNMDEGVGTPASYSECFQFFVAPTDLNDQNPDPSKAPDVINNSWTCPTGEGCTDPNALLAVVENTRAAGIVVVASAGNRGPSCSSVSRPPAIYQASLTVGATNSNDEIANFSSRGAVTVDGSNRLKPNVTAPGVGIRSSVRDGDFDFLGGTSMAGPHVAGQVALLISAQPAMAGDVETLESCIETTAVPLTSSQDCTGVPGDQVPNNVYGWGRVELALPLIAECISALIFADGFESGDTSAWD